MKKESQKPFFAFFLGNSVSQMYTCLITNKQGLLDFVTEVSAVRTIVQESQVRKNHCSLIELVLFLQTINLELFPTLYPQKAISCVFARPAVS